MKGICFIEPLFIATVEGNKTQTRRIEKKPKPRFNVGDIVFLKEPYCEMPFGGYDYKFDAAQIGITYKNKLFMPAKAARHFIEILGVRSEPLQSITDADCLAEGIIEERPEYWNMETGKAAYGIPIRLSKYTIYASQWFDTPREAYASLINQINGRGTWDSNPIVTVYDYALVD